MLGVEGVGGGVLRSILTPFTSDEALVRGEELTPTDMFNLGLSGGIDSTARRDALCDALSLPRGMNAKALLSALNIVSTREEIEKLLKK